MVISSNCCTSSSVGGAATDLSTQPMKCLPVFALWVEHGNNEIADSAGPADVGRKQVDASRHQQPHDFAPQLRVGHHGLDFAGQSPFGGMRFRADTAKLRVGFIDENDDLVERLQNASQPFEDHVRLAVPLAADALEHQHGHTQFTGHGFENEGLAATDGAGDRGPGQAPCPGRP